MLRRHFLSLALSGAVPQDPLQALRRSHPRLLSGAADIARIRNLIKNSAVARKLHRGLVEKANRIIEQPTVEYKLEGPRLLAQSRACLDRVYTLALLYRLDGNRRYLDRAVRELRAASSFPDWNPSHFLDTAEMTHAFAIGCDWLHGSLSPAERLWMRRAIVEKGLDPALAVYPRPRGWHRRVTNWNLVCNGGIALGALAIAEEEPALCREVLRLALESVARALATYAPDGGWPEGPAYWGYATRYAVCLLSGLETALGTDFGYSQLPGFARTGHFRVHMTGPTGMTFNFADGDSVAGNAAQLFWLGRRFREPVYAWHESRQLEAIAEPDPLDLMWFDARAASPKRCDWPLDAVFRGRNVAFLRSDWEDPDAIYVGVKGGDNKSSHGHLDLGTFVLDAGGQRWALDLGHEGYGRLPAYFGSKRWTYYRTRTESHNVVVIDGENQDPKAEAPIVSWISTPSRAEVRIDLTAAYSGKARHFERSLALLDRRCVVVTDVLEAEHACDAVWGMVTDAEIVLKGAEAELRKAGWLLAARVHSPAGAVFAIASTAVPPPQSPNPGTCKLVVRLPEKVTNMRLTISLVPYREGTSKPSLPEGIAG